MIHEDYGFSDQIRLTDIGQVTHQLFLVLHHEISGLFDKEKIERDNANTFSFFLSFFLSSLSLSASFTLISFLHTKNFSFPSSLPTCSPSFYIPYEQVSVLSATEKQTDFGNIYNIQEQRGQVWNKSITIQLCETEFKWSLYM
jgi:hypothetical protein